MQKKNLFASAILMLCTLFVFTGCKEVMSSLDNPVSAYLKVDPASAKIYRGQSYKIPYSTISDAKPIFTTADDKVATVDENGVVTGANRGTTTITIELPATDNYQAASVEFTVEVDALLSIPLDAKELALDEEYNLGVTSVSTGAITYTSSDTNVATVDASGNVKAKGYGDATITISIAATPEYDRTESAEFAATVRIQDFGQLKTAIANVEAGGTFTALLGDNAAIVLNEDLDLTGKKVTIKGNEEKPAIFTVTKSIRGISDNFTIENVKFNASAITGSLFILEGSTVAAKNQDGTDNANYKYIESIKLSNLEVTGLVKAFLRDAQKIYVANLEVDNCVIGFNSQQNVFDFNGKGYPANLKVTNSTIWAPSNTKTNYLLQSGGRVKDLDPNQLEYKQNVTVDSCTFYRVAQGMQINNLKGAGQISLILTLKNSILVDSGSKSGNEVRGWLGGQNSNNPSVTYEKNTYWAGDAVAAGWTNSSKQGYDASGTSLTSDPNFKDPANGDFTPQGADQVSNQTGDPRWFK